MPASTNVYAPSPATLKSLDKPVMDSSAEYWREGSILVLRRGSALPERCVKCNEPADVPMKSFKVSWHHWSLYLLLPLNMVIYLIVSLSVRKTERITAGLCAAHKRRRRNGVALIWLSILSGLGLPLIAVTLAPLGYGGPAMIALGILVFLVLLVAGVIIARVVVAKKIDKEYVWLRGCGNEFLNSLPDA